MLPFPAEEVFQQAIRDNIFRNTIVTLQPVLFFKSGRGVQDLSSHRISMGVMCLAYLDMLVNPTSC